MVSTVYALSAHHYIAVKNDLAIFKALKKVKKNSENSKGLGIML